MTLAALVISLDTKPHPPRLRIMRRKMLSVTPTIGASTILGAIRMRPT
jgi:hypothetical protein